MLTLILTQAPKPLLPNFGMGRVRLYQQDLNMMSILNSKERTLQEFVDMGYVHLTCDCLA